MNETPDTIPLPPRPQAHSLQPMPGGTGAGSTMASLLKMPGSVLYELTRGAAPRRVCGNLVLITLLGIGVFGGITGTLTEGPWWGPVVKITGGALFAALICLPSLYIFAALSGMVLPLRAVAGLLFGATGLTGLLLAGFTPLIWVLGASTGSVVFVGGLLLVVWLVSLAFGIGLLMKSGRALGMTHGVHLFLWCGMFLLVTLQVSCAVRPILGASEDFLPREKKFFLHHWGDMLSKAGD